MGSSLDINFGAQNAIHWEFGSNLEHTMEVSVRIVTVSLVTALMAVLIMVLPAFAWNCELPQNKGLAECKGKHEHPTPVPTPAPVPAPVIQPVVPPQVVSQPTQQVVPTSSSVTSGDNRTRMCHLEPSFGSTGNWELRSVQPSDVQKRLNQGDLLPNGNGLCDLVLDSSQLFVPSPAPLRPLTVPVLPAPAAAVVPELNVPPLTITPDMPSQQEATVPVTVPADEDAPATPETVEVGYPPPVQAPVTPSDQDMVDTGD